MSITRKQKPGRCRPTASANGFTKPSSTSSTRLPFARSCITIWKSCSETPTNGSAITTPSGPILANTVTAIPQWKLFRSQNTWQKKKSWTTKNGGRTIQQIVHPSRRIVVGRRGRCRNRKPPRPPARPDTLQNWWRRSSAR